jgi:threonine/homoserine/homoserine lactone efflux protein
VVVNVLNPKVALFFLAFLPQFVIPARGSIVSQLVLLGLLFVAVAMVIDGVYAMTSGTIGALLTRNARAAKAQRTVAGVAYLALGASAAVTDSNSK